MSINEQALSNGLSKGLSNGLSKAGAQGRASRVQPPLALKGRESMVFKSHRHPHLESRTMENPHVRCESCRTKVRYWDTGVFHRGFGCIVCNPNRISRRDAAAKQEVAP